MGNTKIAESMKTSLENFLAEFNKKLHSDEELNEVIKVLISSLDLIYEKTGIMYCSKCGKKMEKTSYDIGSGQQFSCPKCRNSYSHGGINNR